MLYKTILTFGVDMRFPSFAGGFVVIFWSILFWVPIAIVLKMLIRAIV